MKRTATFVIFVIGIFAASASAQIQPEEDFQSWNDVQLTLPVNKYLDFNSIVTARLGKDSSRLNDSRFAIGLTLKPLHGFSIHPFYTYIRARNANSHFRTEHRLNLRFAYSFPTKWFTLTHRSLFVARRRRPLNSWNYRPSLTIEKEIPKNWIPKAKVFITDEIFYDSLLRRFTRNRFTVGIIKTLTKHLAVDLYYLRQNDGTTRPGDLHVIGTSWKIKM